MNVRLIFPIVTVAGALALGACSSGADETPAVTPSPSASASVDDEPTSEEATEAPTVEAMEEAAATAAPSSGTREAPLAVGETRKISDQSMWTVGMTASNVDAAGQIAAGDEYAPKPAEGERFVVGTLQVTADAAASAAQGGDIADGVDPRASLFVSYVAADGTSYESGAGSLCYTGSDFYSVASTVYADGATVAGDFCIAVPAEKADGGLWRVANGANEAVWIVGS